MVHWNSSPHPISDIRDWSDAGRLELRPDFQRREVWSTPARVMLMDTILRDVPMPKIFLASSIKDGRTYRVVIDGQQRISAILAFLRNDFPLDEPYGGKATGKHFCDLDRATQDRLLSYQIDFNEAINPSDKEVREVYARVNKYTVPLTKQELRRADFPGNFLNISEELAINEYFDRIGLFSPANRKRSADVEYVSELLAAMMDGAQDKKGTLDRATCKTLGHGGFIPGVRYEGSGWSNVTRTIGRIDGSTCRMATVEEPICRERGPLRSHSWPGAGMRARLSVPPSREACSGMTGTEPKVRFKSEGAPIGLPSAPGCRTSRGSRLWHGRARGHGVHRSCPSARH